MIKQLKQFFIKLAEAHPLCNQNCDQGRRCICSNKSNEKQTPASK